MKPISQTLSIPRPDITCKIFLRMIRRFYYRLFRKENPKIWAKRLTKVTFADQLSAAESFVRKYFREENTSLALFILRTLGLNSSDSPPIQSQPEKDGFDLFYTGKVFAKKRFDAMPHSPEFAKAFRYIYIKEGMLPNSTRR